MKEHCGLAFFASIFSAVLAAASSTAAAEGAPAASRDCGNCPEMVAVPAGTFDMGTPAMQGASDEIARHITFAKPFAIGKYEVTFEEWDACVADGGCKTKPADQGWGRGKHPVVNVAWDDAQAYVTWLSRKTGQTYRLPTEPEWEYAARAGTTTTYFWGDSLGKNQANCADCGSKWDDKETAPVGSFAPNVWGFHDTAGNVWEWVQDCYYYPAEDYSRLPTDGSAADKTDCKLRVLRGGSWHDVGDLARSARRYYLSPINSNATLGFRVAKTLP